MDTGKTRAQCVGSFVNKKVMVLQKRYCAGDSNARATLARLRRMGTQGSSWFVVGEEVYSDWSVEELGVPDAGAAEVKAVEAALQLYALHQQSKGSGVALGGLSSSDEKRRSPRGSFGRACRQVEPDLTRADGVTRRLASIEAASDFDGVVYGMRMLMGLIKSADTKSAIMLDYRLLAEDLYWLAKSFETPQGSSLRERVFRRWSRDYYAKPGSSD